MTVFKNYFRVLKKHLGIIIIYMVLFLALIIMFTWNTGSKNDSFSASKVKLMVINEDTQSVFLDAFLDYLEQYAIFIEPKEDEEARKSALFFREVEYILTIPEGFWKDFLNHGRMSLSKDTVPDSANAIFLDNAINNYLNIAHTYIKHLPQISQEQLIKLVEATIGGRVNVKIENQLPDKISASNTFNKLFFNYLGYIIIACFVNGVSVVMFSFTVLEIRARHAASPVPARSVGMQLILGNMVYLFCYLIIFIIAGYIMNKNRMLNAGILLTWLNVLVFSLSCLSFSYLVGITVRSKKAIQAISTAVSLSIAFTSGIFIPQEYLAEPVLKAASFAPGYWYVKANNAIAQIISYDWAQLGKIFGYMGIQLGFAAAIMSMALLAAKRKTQRE